MITGQSAWRVAHASGPHRGASRLQNTPQTCEPAFHPLRDSFSLNLSHC